MCSNFKSTNSSNNIRTNLLIMTDKEIRKQKPKSFFIQENEINCVDDTKYVHLKEHFLSPSRKGQKSFTYKPNINIPILSKNTLNTNFDFKSQCHNYNSAFQFSETTSPFSGSFISEKEIEINGKTISRRNSSSNIVKEDKIIDQNKSFSTINDKIDTILIKSTNMFSDKKTIEEDLALKSYNYLKSIAQSTKNILNIKSEKLVNKSFDCINSFQLDYNNKTKKSKTENFIFMESKFSNNTINFNFKKELTKNSFNEDSIISNDSSSDEDKEEILINIIPCDEV